ncbi:hypothetical protein [Marichromatium sp. AB32]|uniref:hypothetical protein n=1 Tax=Marichromatium sp. AB32 TaxID=2483363 RepID=UPI0011CDAC6D|nr:hypothetical protein [Marichromatium sp. AB32]
MINWEEDLITTLARRRCVIVIGAGVSKNSRNQNGETPKSWDEFLNWCTEEIEGENKELIKLLIASRDLTTACEVIKNNISEDNLTRKIEEE